MKVSMNKTKVFPWVPVLMIAGLGAYFSVAM